MAAADEYWNLGAENTQWYTAPHQRTGHSSNTGGGGGASTGGWGGIGGVLPDWYSSGSNFGTQLNNAAKGLLGTISEDEVYSLTDIDYSNGAFEFTFGRNEGATQYTQQIASFIMRQTLASAGNIGYGKSFNGEGDPKSGGEGLCVSAGLGVGQKGTLFSLGFFGFPGTIGQLFFTVGLPDPNKKSYIDYSVSAQYMIGGTRDGSPVDLSGSGYYYGIGIGAYSVGYSTNTQRNLSIYQGGVSAGFKFTGGYIQTTTWTLPIYIPKLWNAVGGKF